MTAHEIGASLYHHRTKAGMSREMLARKAGVSRSAIEYYEDGHSAPGILAVVKIADALGLTIDDLIGRMVP